MADTAELPLDPNRESRHTALGNRVHLVEHLRQDLRYAFRGMRRSLAFSAMAVLTLALGIGATTSILPVVQAVLLRALPFPDADRLVVLFATSPQRRLYRDSTSFPDVSDWKTQSRAFVDLAAWRIDPFNVTGGAPPERVDGLHASYELLPVLGIRPTLGRSFDRNEQHERRAVALISHALWQRRFGSDPQIVGKTILLNETEHIVIGVLPQGFQFPAFTDIDVITPIAERPERGIGYLFAVARLKPGVRALAAQEELTTIAARLEQAFPDSNRARGINAITLADAAVGRVRTPLLVLMGAAVFVLLIGCANVGHLVLAKGIARQRELAVRSALGAGTARLARQLLTESLSLALIASLLGSLLAFWGSRLLVASLSHPGPPTRSAALGWEQRFVLPPIAPDWTLVAFAIGLALLCGLLCGLPPALMIRKADLNEPLKESSRSQAGSVPQQRLRNLLVIAETALTIVLLMGAGLLLKSFVLLEQVDPGLDPHNVLTADLLLSKRYADLARREAYVGALLDSIGSLPGVERVAVHTDPPFRGGGSQSTFTVQGHADPDPRTGHLAGLNVVSTGFFATVGMPIGRGRTFDRRDGPNGEPVAVINETMARRFWPNSDPIGRHLRLYYDRDAQHWLSIVGVVRDVRYRGRELAPIPQVFLPYEQSPYRHLPYPPEPYLCLVVRTTSDPSALAKAVQARIWTVNKDQPVMHLMPMARLLTESSADRRVYLLLLGLFAGIALVIATAGIYGTSAYAVACRTQEMGIRIALGATRGQILALVLRRGMTLTLVGVAAGIAGSLTLTKVIAGVLYGVTPTDASTFVGIALLFAGVALLATYFPARRAATIDPTIAFRAE